MSFLSVRHVHIRCRRVHHHDRVPDMPRQNAASLRPGIFQHSIDRVDRVSHDTGSLSLGRQKKWPLFVTAHYEKAAIFSDDRVIINPPTSGTESAEPLATAQVPGSTQRRSRSHLSTAITDINLAIAKSQATTVAPRESWRGRVADTNPHAADNKLRRTRIHAGQPVQQRRSIPPTVSALLNPCIVILGYFWQSTVLHDGQERETRQRTRVHFGSPSERREPLASPAFPQRLNRDGATDQWRPRFAQFTEVSLFTA